MLLSVIGDHGFALAGASAIREHALTYRPTSDVDLFGPPLTTADQFAAVVELVVQSLSDAGYTVEVLRSFAQFARLRIIKDGADVLEVDLASIGGPNHRCTSPWDRCCPNATRSPGSCPRCTPAARSAISSTWTPSGHPDASRHGAEVDLRRHHPHHPDRRRGTRRQRRADGSAGPAGDLPRVGGVVLRH